MDKDGGPAFPIIIEGGVDSGLHADRWDGMSLRDYFAIHSEQPGMAELAEAGGMIWKNHHIFYPTDDPQWMTGMSGDKWWEGLSNKMRFQLWAEVRYAQADAMLVEREKQRGGE